MRLFLIYILSLGLGACATSAPNYDNGPLSGRDISQDMASQNLYNMAQNLYAGHDYLGAYTLYGRAYESSGSDRTLTNEIEFGMANSLLRLGQPGEALLRFNALAERGVSSLGLKEGIVESHLRLGNINAASAKMLELSEGGQLSVGSHTLVGILHDLNLNHQEARLSYEKAMEGEGDIANSITNLALSYALTADFQTSHALLNSIETSAETIALIFALEGRLGQAETIITRAFFNRGLGASAVAQNMAFYENLGELSASGRAKAVMLGIVDNN